MHELTSISRIYIHTVQGRIQDLQKKKKKKKKKGSVEIGGKLVDIAPKDTLGSWWDKTQPNCLLKLEGLKAVQLQAR